MLSGQPFERLVFLAAYERVVCATTVEEAVNPKRTSAHLVSSGPGPTGGHVALPTVEQGRASGVIPIPASHARAAAARSHAPAAGISSARIALVHDWCPSFRGGERVLAELCRMFSAVDVFTLFDFLSPELKAQFFPGVSFHTSIANRLPLVHRYYRALFSMCPFLIVQFAVTSYDAVVSSSAAFAGGIFTRPDQPHVLYVHAAALYAWGEQFSFLASA